MLCAQTAEHFPSIIDQTALCIAPHMHINTALNANIDFRCKTIWLSLVRERKTDGGKIALM